MTVNQNTFNTNSVVQLFVGNRENGLEYLHNTPSDFYTKLDQPIHLNDNTYVRLTSLTNNEPYNPYGESLRAIRKNPTGNPLYEAGFITLCLTAYRTGGWVAGWQEGVTPRGVDWTEKYGYRYYMEVLTNNKTYMGPTWRPAYDHGSFINNIFDEKCTRFLQFDGVFGANTTLAGARTRYKNTRQRFQDPLPITGSNSETRHRHWVREEEEFTIKGANVLELDNLEQMFIKESRPFNQRWYNRSHVSVNDDQNNEQWSDEYFKFTNIARNTNDVRQYRLLNYNPVDHQSNRELYSLCSINSPTIINSQTGGRRHPTIFDNLNWNTMNYVYYFPNVVSKIENFVNVAETGNLTYLPVAMGPQHFVDLFYINGAHAHDGTTMYDVGRSKFYQKRRERLTVDYTSFTSSETFLFSTNTTMRRMYHVNAAMTETGFQVFLKIPYFSTANYSSQCESYSTYFLAVDENTLPSTHKYTGHRWLDVPCKQLKAPIIGGSGFKWGVYMPDIDRIFDDLTEKIDFARTSLGENSKDLFGAPSEQAVATRREGFLERQAYYELVSLGRDRLKKMLAESCIANDGVFKKKLQQLQNERQLEDVWKLAKVFTGMVEGNNSKLYHGVVPECYTQEMDMGGNLPWYTDEVYKSVNEYYQYVNDKPAINNLQEHKFNNKFTNIKRYVQNRQNISLFTGTGDADGAFFCWPSMNDRSYDSYSLVTTFNKVPRNYTLGHDTIYVYAEGLIEDKKVFGFRSPLLSTGNFLTSTNFPIYGAFGGEENEMVANLATQPPTQFLNMKLSTNQVNKVKTSLVDQIRIQIGLPDGTLALLPEHSNTTGVVEFYTK